MAKLNPQSRSETMKAKRAAKKEAQIQQETSSETPNVSPVEKVATTEVKNPDLNEILKRLEKVEKENAELKKPKENMFVKGKERFTGPRTFSYKMWGNIPVLSFTTFRKDPTKDLLFKNQFGQFESNHYLHVDLANGETVDVEVNDFNKNCNKSEKLEAKNQYGEVIDLENLKLSKTFTFDTTDHGTFTVALGAIN